MKHFNTLFFLFLFLFASCKKDIQKTSLKPFTVSGTVSPLLENKNVKLIAYTKDTTAIIDATVIKDKQFNLISNTKKMALYYLIIEGVQDSLPVILSENQLSLIIDKSSFEDANFGKNVVQKQYHSFLNKFEILDSLGKKNYKYASDFIKGNADNELSTIIVNSLKDDKSISFKQFESLFLNLDSLQQHSQKGILLKNYITTKNLLLKKIKHTADSIAIASKKATAIKRQLAPLFAGESLDGSDYNLSTLIAKNKVVIIDFWASWCGPCRVSNPTLVRLYKKYKHRGLGIISVSEDKSQDAWRNAIKQDRLIWPQIIDDSQRIAFMYNVSAIPHVVVLDAKGGFFKRKTTSHQLEAAIIQLLNE